MRDAHPAIVGPRRRVLLTGAAGLLGGEIAGRLLDRGHAVTGLVNRNRDIRRNDGSSVPTGSWEDAPRLGVVRLLPGDIGADGFGWNEARRMEVASAHDLVIHAAAVTQFDADPAVHRAVNVEGTARVLALAAEGGMDVLHIGTAYVCGTREGMILEDELDHGQSFANGYEASKAEAERLVRAYPLRWAVARPSIVVGDHATGAIRAFDTIYQMLKLFAEGRVRAMPAAAGATLDLVPVDHVAGGIVEIAERFGQAAGRAYHLVSGAPTPVTAFPETLRRFPGLAYPALVDPAGFDPAALPASERRFFVRGAALYAGYFSRNPRFDDADFRALTGRACPPVGPAWWGRLVEHALRVGFIRLRGDRNPSPP